jgi:hypothetical protein
MLNVYDDWVRTPAVTVWAMYAGRERGEARLRLQGAPPYFAFPFEFLMIETGSARWCSL